MTLATHAPGASAADELGRWPIRGIVPALVTPFHDDESLDLAALSRVLDHVLGAGVHGVFVAGSQGEFWSLSVDEHDRLIRAAVEQVDGRVPVYAGASAVCTRDAITLARQASAAGADAVTILAPHLIQPSPKEARQHIEAVAAAVDVPVVFYDHPLRTGVRLDVDFVAELAHKGVIAAVKESSGDLARALAYVTALPPECGVMMGNDALVAPALLGGCSGAVASTANVAPALHVQIYEAVRSGDFMTAIALQRRLSLLRDAFALGTFPTVVRDAMTLIGIPVGACRAPVQRLDAPAFARLRDALHHAGIAVMAEET
jgi:4-hydroxy-tetrahydrodipicolinate synthase